jgi:hypothetical protein
MAYRHLLELCPALESVITNDAMQCRDEDKTVVTGDAKAKHKSCQVVKIMKDPLFWHSLTWLVPMQCCFMLHKRFNDYHSMKCHLEPLTITTNITQASFCCLDQVLMTFGHLIMQTGP